MQISSCSDSNLYVLEWVGVHKVTEWGETERKILCNNVARS